MREEYTVKTREEIEAKAAALGLAVIWPLENEVCMDMDEILRNNYMPNPAVMACLTKHTVLDPMSQLVTISAGGNRHVYFKLIRKATETERLLIQACLGSDPVKEILNIMGEPLAMFETVEGANAVKVWREMYAKNTSTDDCTLGV